LLLAAAGHFCSRLRDYVVTQATRYDSTST